MKKLFALLVLLNLAVFAWDFQRSEKAAGSREVPQLQGVPRITLVSELPTPTAPSQAYPSDPAAETIAEAAPSAPAGPLSGETAQPVSKRPLSREAGSSPGGESLEPEPRAALAPGPTNQEQASAANAGQAGAEEPVLGAEPISTPIGEKPAAEGESGELAPVPESVPGPGAKELPAPVASVGSPPLLADDERLDRRCISIGPFALRNEAIQAELALTKKFGQSINLRKEAAKVQIGYWVVIPPQGTTAEAIKKVEELKSAGVTDLWRFTRGELANAISLGLFTGRRYAEKQRDQIAKMGFEPEVRPRYTDQNRYWLDLALGPGEEISDSDWRTGIEESPEAEQSVVECR